MWIIHSPNRHAMYRLDSYRAVRLEEKTLILAYGEQELILGFATQTDAKQALSYLKEAIRRGDKIIQL